MNLKRTVWLPPDGDPRLIRFQQKLLAWAGFPDLPVLPPHLDLKDPGGRPLGAVRSEGWGLDGADPVLAARDDEGPVGVFRFGLRSVKPWVEADLLQFPLAGPWCWDRGLIATLEIEGPLDPDFILWSWTSRHGWKASPPRR